VKMRLLIWINDTKTYKVLLCSDYMVKGRDTLVEYVSNEGERVKVVSGRYRHEYKKSVRSSYSISTRVYVSRELIGEYYEGDGIDQEDIFLIMPQLGNLACGGASSSEIVRLLDDYTLTFREFKECTKDGDDSIPWFSQKFKNKENLF
jgi:hypothetical protein